MKRRILYIETFDLSRISSDIPTNLANMGYDLISVPISFHVLSYNKSNIEESSRLIEQYHPDIVFSYDFSRAAAESCFIANIPYISWVYDCPHEALYSEQAFYRTNHIYIFDRKQFERLKKIGLKNVFYMSLAAYPERVIKAVSGLNSYETDVSFVGGLYYMDGNETVLSQLTGYGKDIWNDLVARGFMKWDGKGNIYDIMPDEFVELFDSFNNGKSNEEAPYMTRRYKFESYILSKYLAHRERVKILNDLSEKYKVRFYTRDTKVDELSPEIDIRPGVDYNSDEIFKIYKSSKVNINISLHSIESGLSQRFFDVMAAGGFLLSSYQEEIDDYFEIGKDLVVFHNEKELLELTDYYISHDEEREKIALNGQKKVLENHSYIKKLTEIMSEFDPVL